MIETCACFEDRHPKGHLPRCLRCPVAMHCAEKRKASVRPRKQRYARPLLLLLVRVMRALSLASSHGNVGFWSANRDLGQSHGRPPHSVLVAVLHHEMQDQSDARRGPCRQILACSVVTQDARQGLDDAAECNRRSHRHHDVG